MENITPTYSDTHFDEVIRDLHESTDKGTYLRTLMEMEFCYNENGELITKAEELEKPFVIYSQFHREAVVCGGINGFVAEDYVDVDDALAIVNVFAKPFASLNQEEAAAYYRGVSKALEHSGFAPTMTAALTEKMLSDGTLLNFDGTSVTELNRDADYLFFDYSQKNPKPWLISVTQTEIKANGEVSEETFENAYKKAMNLQEPAEPSRILRFFDRVNRFFGGKGLDVCNEYRNKKAALDYELCQAKRKNGFTAEKPENVKKWENRMLTEAYKAIYQQEPQPQQLDRLAENDAIRDYLNECARQTAATGKADRTKVNESVLRNLEDAMNFMLGGGPADENDIFAQVNPWDQAAGEEKEPQASEEITGPEAYENHEKIEELAPELQEIKVETLLRKRESTDENIVRNGPSLEENMEKRRPEEFGIDEETVMVEPELPELPEIKSETRQMRANGNREKFNAQTREASLAILEDLRGKIPGNESFVDAMKAEVGQLEGLGAMNTASFIADRHTQMMKAWNKNPEKLMNLVRTEIIPTEKAGITDSKIERAQTEIWYQQAKKAAMNIVEELRGRQNTNEEFINTVKEEVGALDGFEAMNTVTFIADRYNSMTNAWNKDPEKIRKVLKEQIIPTEKTIMTQKKADRATAEIRRYNAANKQKEEAANKPQEPAGPRTDL